MFSFFKNIFLRIYHYTEYQNSKKLYNILYTANYSEAKNFIENYSFILTNEIISQWVSNVYSTGHGVPIHNESKEFNEKFMLYAQTPKNKVIVAQFLKSYEFNPAIVSISFNNIEFKNKNQTKKVPYSKQNFEDLTKWLITECTLNNFIKNYPNILELLNENFNINNIYSLSTQQSEVFKLFVSIFHKQSLDQQLSEKIKVETIKNKDVIPYFNFNNDFTNIPIKSQVLISKIGNLFIDWDWKKELNYEQITEESHNVDKILSIQIQFCIEQYLKMPSEFRETMKNHEGLTMSELLEQNLSKILSNLTEIKNENVTNNAEKLLFNQTVQKTILVNQKNSN